MPPAVIVLSAIVGALVGALVALASQRRADARQHGERHGATAAQASVGAAEPAASRAQACADTTADLTGAPAGVASENSAIGLAASPANAGQAPVEFDAEEGHFENGVAVDTIEEPGAPVQPDEPDGPDEPDDAIMPAATSSTPNLESAGGAVGLSARSFDMGRLVGELVSASDPIAALKREVGRIRTAEARAAEDGTPAPSGIESYLARALDEAGLFDKGLAQADLTLVRPRRSRTLYLRVNDHALAWGRMVRVLGVESALNRALFAWDHFCAEDGAAGSRDPSVEDCYRFNQALASSVTAQLGTARLGRAAMADGVGEWFVRQAIATGIESFRLPQRLSASFRTNLMGGDAAIVAKHAPSLAFPASVWSESLGRIVPATRQMREQAASAYAMRVALLLAWHAFMCSRRLCHVFVAITADSPAEHRCLLWGDVHRDDLAQLDLTQAFDPEKVCRSLGFHMTLDNGALQAIEQGFSLESERFCPKTRYEPVDLSKRVLPRLEGELLGAERVCDLAINEHARREEVAGRILRRLGNSTAGNVRLILDEAASDRDPTVRDAAERTVGKLIDGTLSEDALAINEEFVSGDALSRACDEAMSLLNANQPQRAISVLTDALAPVDALDVYADDDNQVWREFSSYAGRTVYNRLLARDGRRVRLVPDAYYNAQLLMSTALLLARRPQEALGFARRACDLDPLNVAGHLRIVRCLEVAGDYEGAIDTLREYLAHAFDPEGIGTAYYRMAFMAFRMGDRALAGACYRKAALIRCGSAQMATVELHTLAAMGGLDADAMTPEEVDEALRASDVPVAPTEEVSEVLVNAAMAATDAEVFPVARNFAVLLGALSGDDVIHDIASSLELEPDR